MAGKTEVLFLAKAPQRHVSLAGIAMVGRPAQVSRVPIFKPYTLT